MEGAICLVLGHTMVHETNDTWQKHILEQAPAPGMKLGVPLLFLPAQEFRQYSILRTHSKI